MLKNKFISFFIFALITFSASFIGGLATMSHKEPWYSTLIKSGFNPPDWVFAPVWTTLYLFMTIAIWQAWHKNYNINLVLILEIRVVICFHPISCVTTRKSDTLQTVHTRWTPRQKSSIIHSWQKTLT